jgi:predicted hydrocarbon binding protein
MAKACGRKIYAKIKENARDLEEALLKFSDLMSERNWGEFSLTEVDFKNGTGRILIENSFETRKKGAVGQACCHFLTNFTAGFLSELFAKKHCGN